MVSMSIHYEKLRVHTNLVKHKKAFQYDAYRPRSNKDEQWTSSHEADCGQTDTCENITFPLRSVITITHTQTEAKDTLGARSL